MGRASEEARVLHEKRIRAADVAVEGLERRGRLDLKLGLRLLRTGRGNVAVGGPGMVNSPDIRVRPDVQARQNRGLRPRLGERLRWHGKIVWLLQLLPRLVGVPAVHKTITGLLLHVGRLHRGMLLLLLLRGLEIAVSHHWLLRRLNAGGGVHVARSKLLLLGGGHHLLLLLHLHLLLHLLLLSLLELHLLLLLLLSLLHLHLHLLLLLSLLLLLE